MRLFLMIFLVLITGAASAQVVFDQPITTYDQPIDQLESTTPTLPTNVTIQTRAQAFWRVYETTLTTASVRTRTVYTLLADGSMTSRTQTIIRRKRIWNGRSHLAIRPGYFLHPLSGNFYRNNLIATPTATVTPTPTPTATP